jgi:hypothetical protein
VHYTGVRLTRDYNASAQQTFDALMQASEQLGFNVESASLAAKHLAVRQPNSKALIVFVVESAGGNSTVVAGLSPDSKSFKSTVIQDILVKAESLVINKGML